MNRIYKSSKQWDVLLHMWKLVSLWQLIPLQFVCRTIPALACVLVFWFRVLRRAHNVFILTLIFKSMAYGTQRFNVAFIMLAFRVLKRAHNALITLISNPMTYGTLRFNASFIMFRIRVPRSAYNALILTLISN